MVINGLNVKLSVVNNNKAYVSRYLDKCILSTSLVLNRLYGIPTLRLK